MRWKKFISIWFYSRHSLLLLSLSPSAFFDSARWSRKIFFIFFPFCVYYFCARLIEVLIWHGRPHSNGPIFNGKGGKNPARLPFISLSTKLADNGPSFPTRWIKSVYIGAWERRNEMVFRETAHKRVGKQMNEEKTPSRKDLKRK
jgi:hypothetical protein